MSTKLLFICTGNTCRSPMAEGLARKIMGDSFQVSSAGIEAYAGERASSHALMVLGELKVDLSAHRSRRIGADLMADADWIIPMTKAHEVKLKRLYPQYSPKIRCLGDWGSEERDVLDPFGGSVEVYRQTAQKIGDMLRELKGCIRSGEDV